jgi:FkbH-like protein
MISVQSELSLHWLPDAGDFKNDLAAALAIDNPRERWMSLVALANRRLNFLETIKLDRALTKAEVLLDVPDGARMRVALVGSATLDHHVPGIRIGGLRRGLLVDTWVAPFGQWRQEILDPSSGLHEFKPDAVLLSIDAKSLVPVLPLNTSSSEILGILDRKIEEIGSIWRAIRDHLGAIVLHQTALSTEPLTFGHFERLVPASKGSVGARLDAGIVEAAAREGVLLLDLRTASLPFGVQAMTSQMLWHHAKQEITPAATPWYGDQVGRILAATRGLSKKVLVLDLDNTLWGGVIGDDGLENIVLGQGNAVGEAFAAFQRYAKDLSGRGVILAVSSKNDLAVAEAAFNNHPEMVLRRHDIAAFEASWGDKPTALRRIAQDLNVGLDALVFFDDNPFERELMRRTLPMVAVPEVPEAIEDYIACLANAGYFEAVALTADDLRRTEQYSANARRQQAGAASTDLSNFLHSLDMSLTVLPFQAVDVPRIAQLINKSNQFNVTTRRYTEVDVARMMNDPLALTFSARLDDCFGSNGIISVVIGNLVAYEGVRALDIDTWLMSCRVLGRCVENAMLSIVADAARSAGAERLIAHYRPTPKNGMVRDLFSRLGFSAADEAVCDGETLWTFDLNAGALEAPEYFSLITTAEAAQ